MTANCHSNEGNLGKKISSTSSQNNKKNLIKIEIAKIAINKIVMLKERKNSKLNFAGNTMPRRLY